MSCVVCAPPGHGSWWVGRLSRPACPCRVRSASNGASLEAAAAEMAEKKANAGSTAEQQVGTVDRARRGGIVHEDLESAHASVLRAIAHALLVLVNWMCRRCCPPPVAALPYSQYMRAGLAYRATDARGYTARENVLASSARVYCVLSALRRWGLVLERAVGRARSARVSADEAGCTFAVLVTHSDTMLE